MDLDPTTVSAFPRFYIIDFGPNKRSVNPYTVIDCIRDVTGYAPRAVAGNNKSSFTVELERESQSVDILKLTSVADTPCTVSLHPRFNYQKGIIYIHEFDIDDVAQFREGLMSSYPNIANVEIAAFIWVKSPNTTAFLVTFHRDHLPYSIYVPGERQDTKVYKYHNRPLICKRCQQYGHTVKRCSQTVPVCRRCSAGGHEIDACQAADFRCLHCGAAHAVGSVDCPRQQEEQELVDVQDREKVTFMRARQILQNNNEFVDRPTSCFPTHFNCTFPEEQKRKITPWLLERCLQTHLGSKPKSIRSLSKTTFVVEVSTDCESRSMSGLSTLNGIPVQIEVNTSLDVQKALIYIYGYDMSEFDSFRVALMRQHGLQHVEEALWIKPRSQSTAKPLLLTFRSIMPQFISVPGEMMKTKVYEYKRRPLFCRSCQEYGHSQTRCTGAVRCAKCAAADHNAQTCSETVLKCHHCGGQH